MDATLRIRTDANCFLLRPHPMLRIRTLIRKSSARQARQCAFVPLCFCVLITCFSVAENAFAQSPAPNDYSDGKSWLCRPDRHDACDVDLTTTIISSDGKLTRENFSADSKAPIDC